MNTDRFKSKISVYSCKSVAVSVPVPAHKISSAAVWLRLVAALLLLAAGSLLILEAVVIAAGGSLLKSGLLLLPGFVILGASIWLLITTYERLH